MTCRLAPTARFTAVEQQLLNLLDDVDGDHTWGHDPARVPLHGLLDARRASPAHGSLTRSLSREVVGTPSVCDGGVIPVTTGDDVEA